ncbi:hypothetical protein KP509_11G054100 [Ceratopteris richardii]|uniref:Wax synthase domain-containing protein n=1 Tax=Ceratopteris richardii TaxID=49495 RepID=A0A8T2TPK1_CERRI|nr:hypothetical protein KP509_11G054100 [Ceratopteris richardii]KAH7425442.1 hypothetical protein KP509_11G054100 [Ceratopteris richardii]
MANWGLSQELRNVAASSACLVAVYLGFPKLPRGWPRLVFLLPALVVFALVPFSIRSHILRSTLSFLLLWVCPAKLLLRCWDIVIDYPIQGFLYFCLTSVLPVNVKGRSIPTDETWYRTSLFFHLLHLFGLFATLNALWFMEGTSGWFDHASYCLLVYFGAEGILGILSELASLLLSVEVHPLFNNPFSASSLSDFWGRRWNLFVSSLIRETVYNPILIALSGGRQQYGAKVSSSCSDISKGNFRPERDICRLNSGVEGYAAANSLMPENDVRHFSPSTLQARAKAATWEVTCFFVLHGVASILEVFVRRKFLVRKILPKPIAIFCTLGFVFFSAAWLFMPPIIRSGIDLQLIAEFRQVQDVIVGLLTRQTN